ncbi:cation:proton antiporter [Candidatus Sumerlaeota bacterium]|nr:cation:proton antiporter [Candidatus Sumerlaeota bacterium]
MGEHIPAGLTLILALGVAAQWLAWRLKLPSIVLLMGFGFLAGPVMGWLDPDALMGELLLPLVSMSVALILFEGGLTLRLEDLSKIGATVRNLVTIGVAVTWALAAALAALLLGMEPPLAVLFGAILTVTGPTVIQPMLRHIRPRDPTGSILKWEGIVIDPIGALLAVIVLEAILSGSMLRAPADVLMALGKTVVIGGGLGAAGAVFCTAVLRRYWAPDYLQNGIILAVVILAHVLTNHFQPEAGLAAVTVMGVMMINQRYARIEHIVEFKEQLQVLLISVLFIVLTARLDAKFLLTFGWRGWVFVALLVLLVRPAAVFASTWRSKLTLKDKLFLCSLAPRGIVAAAVAAVFSLEVGQSELLPEAIKNQAALLTPAMFLVIFSLVVIYGVAAPIVARRLRIADANPQGVLFAGGDYWVLTMARVLRDEGFNVLIVDTNQFNVKVAQLEGVPAYHGSVLFEGILDEVPLGGIGRLLAMTPNDGVNSLAARNFTRIFGRSEVYQLREGGGDRTKVKKAKLSSRLEGRALFGENVSYGEIQRRFREGGVIHAFTITEEFTYAKFREAFGEEALPLFIVTEGKGLRVMTNGDADPQPGQKLIALVDKKMALRGSSSRPLNREPDDEDLENSADL